MNFQIIKPDSGDCGCSGVKNISFNLVNPGCSSGSSSSGPARWDQIIGRPSCMDSCETVLQHIKDNLGLGGLNNVTITSPANDHGLYYNSSTSTWENKSILSTLPLSATAPIQYNSGTGVISSLVSNTSQDGYLTSVDWNIFNNKQPAGNYITSLTGEATASGPGAAAVTLSNAAVIGKVLTGLNITGGSVVATDTILQAFGKVQNQISALLGGVTFQSVWNASTNSPSLASSTGTKGHYYVVNVAGSTNLDGITDWKVGDWAIYDGTAWQKVDNTDAVSSVNGFVGAVSLTTFDVTEVTNLYYTDARARAAVSLTTTGTSGAATYNSSTGVFNIPQYPSLGSFSATSPIFYNSTTGVISSQAASATLEGYVTTGTQSFSGNKTIINDTDTGNTLLTLRNNVNGNESSSKFKIESNGSNSLEFAVNSSLWDGGAYGGQSQICASGGVLNITAGSNVVLISKPAVRAGSGNYSEFASLATAARTATLQDASGTIAFTSDIPSLSGVVLTTTNQTIADVKTFTSTPIITKAGDIGIIVNNTTTSNYQALGLVAGTNKSSFVFGNSGAATFSIQARDKTNLLNASPSGNGLIEVYGLTGNLSIGSNSQVTDTRLYITDSLVDGGNGTRVAPTALTYTNRKLLYVTSTTSTYNTTAAARTNYAGYFENVSTRSSGSNNLTNVGLYATASGGQINTAAILDGATTITGALTAAAAAFSGNVTVPDEAYSSGWNGSLQVPTKNAIYDKLESLGAVFANMPNTFTNYNIFTYPSNDDNYIRLKRFSNGAGTRNMVFFDSVIVDWQVGQTGNTTDDFGFYRGSTQTLLLDASNGNAWFEANVKAGKFLVNILNTAPSSSSDTGEMGEIRWTNGYVYLCTATNTWLRAALATW